MGNSNTISHHGANSSSVVRRRDEKPLNYTLKIQSFSMLKAAINASYDPDDRYESQIFNAGGFKWKLALYPNGDFQTNRRKDHISLYLVSAEDDILSSGLEINVMITFLIYDNLRDKYWTIQDGKVKRFHAMKKEWGFNKLISLINFYAPSNGLLVNDCCVFGVDIFVMNSNNDGNKGEVLSLINQPKNNIHSWQITNFSLNKDLYSSLPFTVENYNWKIWLYPKGGLKQTTLSLYLEFDNFKELPKGFKAYVEYEIALLSHFKVEPMKKIGKSWIDEKSKCWGYRDFISLSDLKDPSKGFLQNDALTVEVKINVISNLILL